MTRIGVALFAIWPLLALSFGVAAAAPTAWRIDADASSLDIIYLINGEERRGLFERFKGTAEFDADALEAADLDFTVDMDSVDVGDPFGTSIVKTDDWFGAFNHPVGAFSLTSMTPRAGGGYDFTGDLTIKGLLRPIEGALTLDLAPDTARAVGSTTFDRSLFNIGVGLTSLFVEVGDTVTVEFAITASPVEKE